MTTTWGAPAVIHEKGNGLKQLLLHGPPAQLRIGHRHKSLPFPPQAGRGLQPQAAALPGPYHNIPPGPGRSRRGAGKGQLHFSLSTPKPWKGLTEEIPALSMHVSGYSPGSRDGRDRQTLTFVQQQLLQGVPPLESFLRSGPAGEGQRVGKVKLRKPRSPPAVTQHEQNISSR